MTDAPGCPDPSVCASDGECEDGYLYHEWPDLEWNSDDDD